MQIRLYHLILVAGSLLPCFMIVQVWLRGPFPLQLCPLLQCHAERAFVSTRLAPPAG